MKGLFVGLLCATVGYCVTSSPLPQEVDSTVESTEVREAKELPVPGRFHGGFIKPQVRINPLFSSTQQHQIASGGIHNQQLGVHPVSSPSDGHIHQQSGVKPVGSQLHQTSRPELATTVQPEVIPFLQGTHQHHHQQQISNGVQISGELINEQMPINSHGPTTDTITSKNAGVHVEDTLHEKPIEILSQNSDLYPDGSHFNVWESANGIKVQEEGTVKVNGKVEIQSVTGSISYMDPDGNPIHLTYIADENGFQPQGDHLPTPPPIPQSVVRTLEYIAAHPWVEEDHVKAASEVTLVKEELPVIDVA